MTSYYRRPDLGVLEGCKQAIDGFLPSPHFKLYGHVGSISPHKAHYTMCLGVSLACGIKLVIGDQIGDMVFVFAVYDKHSTQLSHSLCLSSSDFEDFFLPSKPDDRKLPPAEPGPFVR